MGRENSRDCWGLLVFPRYNQGFRRRHQLQKGTREQKEMSVCVYEA